MCDEKAAFAYTLFDHVFLSFHVMNTYFLNSQYVCERIGRRGIVEDFMSPSILQCVTCSVPSCFRKYAESVHTSAFHQSKHHMTQTFVWNHGAIHQFCF